MDILLLAVNAKYIHTNLAIYSLRQYAVHAVGEKQKKEYEEHILLREYTINHELDTVLRGIYELRPAVLCISCYLWNIRMVREIVADYKKLDEKVHIYLGGPEVSYDAKKCMERMPEIDGIITGEGEATFYELARYYLEGHPEQENTYFKSSDEQMKALGEGAVEPYQKYSRADIRGLCYRAEDGRICVNPYREPLDFAALPFPYADMENLGGFAHKIIYYETSRGCPFSCCYCLSSVEKSLRLRELSLVEKELQIFLEQRVAQVKFVDRTFNCNKAHAMHIWNYLYEHDNGVTNFHFEIAADLLDDEQIALLAKMRPGLVQLEIGIQSTNPRTIEAIHRRMDLKKVEECVKKVRQARNIHQHLDLIAGLPYEDYVSFAKSFDDVYCMKPDQLQLGFLKVLKGSAMADMTAEHEVRFKSEPPYEVLSTKYLPYDDLLRLKDIEEMVEVYYNSGQFSHALPHLAAQFDGAFAMFEALAHACRVGGYFEGKQSRMERFEILYRFAQKMYREACSAFACFTECLLYDLYNREKPKVQPSFAPKETMKKEQLREMFVAFGVEKEQAGQCYVAHFSYDLERAAAGETVRCENICLFDYAKRDPLSGSCMVLRKLAE